MQVRVASLDDAQQLCEVLRSSIEKLCIDDHLADPVILGAWLSNKTVENVINWTNKTGTHLLVADQDRVVVGVGCVTARGEIVLNYVAPTARFTGVSSAMLQSLEERSWKDGNSEIMLDSTATARRFYRDRGYVDDGPPGGKFGLTTFSMRKVKPSA